MQLSLDLALTRWSVICESWGRLSSGSAPILGVFLAGWYWRDMGNSLPSKEEIGKFADSFRVGWREADDFIEIQNRE